MDEALSRPVSTCYSGVNCEFDRDRTYKLLLSGTNVTDEEVYNTYGCDANNDGVYGTPSSLLRCGGNPINQRLYSAQFMIKI